MPDDLVSTVPEAAQTFKVSEDTILRWLDRGVLPEVLPGASRRRLIPRAAIIRIVEQASDGWDPSAAVSAMRGVMA